MMRMGSLWFGLFQACWKIDKDVRVIRSEMDEHCLKWEGHVEGMREDHLPEKGYEHQKEREAELLWQDGVKRHVKQAKVVGRDARKVLQ